MCVYKFDYGPFRMNPTAPFPFIRGQADRTKPKFK